MLDEQEGRCKICRAEFEDAPHVDHDHETREVRGLLCHHCNTGIGLFRHDVKILKQAISYLRGEE